MDEEGPATRAGIELGDVIIAIDGETVREEKDLIAAVISRTVGESIRLTVSREGERVEIVYIIPSEASRA